MAETDIGTRIISIIDGEKSPANFCRKAGWTSGDISNIRKNTNSSVGYLKLKGILDAYPSISAEWLMRGEGDMLRVGGDSNNINVQLANGHGNNQQYSAGEVAMQEVAHLKALLLEKERTIQILMKE